MNQKHRPINDQDLIDYLQYNQALLETILDKLQRSSSAESIEEDSKMRDWFLERTKQEFTSKTVK